MKQSLKFAALIAGAFLTLSLVSCPKPDDPEPVEPTDYAATYSFDAEFSEDFFKVFDISVSYYDLDSDTLQTKTMSVDDSEIHISGKSTEKQYFGGRASITKKETVEDAEKYSFTCTFKTELKSRKSSVISDSMALISGTSATPDNLDEYISTAYEEPISAVFAITDYDGTIEDLNNYKAKSSFSVTLSEDCFKLFDVSVIYFNGDTDEPKTATVTSDNNPFSVSDESTERQLFGGIVKLSEKADADKTQDSYELRCSFLNEITTRKYTQKRINSFNFSPDEEKNLTERIEEVTSKTSMGLGAKITNYDGTVGFLLPEEIAELIAGAEEE